LENEKAWLFIPIFNCQRSRIDRERFLFAAIYNIILIMLCTFGSQTSFLPLENTVFILTFNSQEVANFVLGHSKPRITECKKIINRNDKVLGR